MDQLYHFVFWAAIVLTSIGGLLGLLGVWVKEFWKSEAVIKLFLTDVILATTSVIVAIVIKFLQ